MLGFLGCSAITTIASLCTPQAGSPVSVVPRKKSSQSSWAERGQTVSAFVTAEVQAQTATITPEEIVARVRADRAKLPTDEEQAHREARSVLVRERAGQALQELVERLSREARVTVTLRPPEPPVLTVSAGDGPAWGSPAAPVTIVGFADFECLVCKESLPVMQEVRS